MLKSEKKLTKAFTLVELLIVISIISILAVIALSAFRFTQARSRDAPAPATAPNLIMFSADIVNNYKQYIF